MNPLEERLNDHLNRPATRNGQPLGNLRVLEAESASQADLHELFALARHLQAHPQVQVAPDFAGQLERRMLRRQAELRLQQKRGRFSSRTFFHAHRVLGSALVACLLCCLFGTSLLALAAQTGRPGNLLYGLKRWEQQVQIQFARPDDQVTMHLGLARDDLNALPSLATANHFQDYDETLRDLDHQVAEADTALTSVPAGLSHDQLVQELASFKRTIRQTLRPLLPKLPFQECLTTTTVLAHSGDTVPQLTRATVILPVHVHANARVSLEGTNMAATAQLVVNGRVDRGLGTLHDDLLTYEVNWDGHQPLQSLGILNPDGTAAQITMITVKQNTSNGKANGGSNGNANGNKPTSTPTPNGNKPTSTPTPNGNKPSSTPTPHH